MTRCAPDAIFVVTSHDAVREQLRIGSRGPHWDALDVDISIAGLPVELAGQTNRDKTFAA